MQIRILHSQLALLVIKLHPQFAVELGIQVAVKIIYLALQSHHTHGMKLHHTLSGIHSIDFLHSDILFWECKTQGGVAHEQERDVFVLQRCRGIVIAWIRLGHSDYVAKAQRVSVTIPLVKHSHQSPA